jgi:hypothetical protein
MYVDLTLHNKNLSVVLIKATEPEGITGKQLSEHINKTEA